MTKQTEERPMDSDWFRRMAEFESTCESISVGGFAHDLGMLRPLHPVQRLEQSALGKLVELARRRAGIDIEELAKRAEVELTDLIELERGGLVSVERRTMDRLCDLLDLPRAGVMELAGLTRKRDASLSAAVVRFAVHAKGIEKLSCEEQRALDEFVKDLAKATDRR